jgi:uncharacterized membrane protein YhaH (DUF805 family)
MKKMTPIDWAMRPLKRYADFSGRAPRAEYWWFYLAYIIFLIVVEILTRISVFFGILGLAYLALIIPMIAVAVRRLHDINRTGWWLLAPLGPYLIGFAMILPAMMSGAGGPPSFTGLGIAGIFMAIGMVLAIVLFIFSLLPGTRGPNRYGPDPYDDGSNLEEVFA